MRVMCTVCGAGFDGASTARYCSEGCRVAGRRAAARVRKVRQRSRDRSTDAGTAPPAGTYPLAGVALARAIDDDDLAGVSRQVAHVLARRIATSAATGSEAGLASLTRELRECMRVVAEASLNDSTELGQLLNAEHRFGGPATP